jgi:DNA-binding response OmpR family regulator
VIRFVNIALNINTGELIVDEFPSKLTAKEAQLLEMFIRNPGMTISKDQILDRIWGIESSVMENSVEIYVHYLRKKISKSKVYIKTIRGLGYVLKEKEHVQPQPVKD